jgi:hypothetical protein
MPNKPRRKGSDAKPAADKKAVSRREKGWDERLRTVGDARFVEVQWSGRDHPSWPLPKK